MTSKKSTKIKITKFIHFPLKSIEYPFSALEKLKMDVKFYIYYPLGVMSQGKRYFPERFHC